METFRSRFILICSLGAALPTVAGGCHGTTKPPPPMPTTTVVLPDPAEQPLPRPEEGLAYVKAALSDKTRLIIVAKDREFDGPLDSYGRSKLRKAVEAWWKGVETVSRVPKRGEVAFRVTPDMGIRIYPPGSAAAAQKNGAEPQAEPDVQIMVFKARQLSRVLINDPRAGRVNQGVYVIPSTEPMDWLNRLFAGKL